MILLLQEVLAYIEGQHSILEDLELYSEESDEQYREIYCKLARMIMKLLKHRCNKINVETKLIKYQNNKMNVETKLIKYQNNEMNVESDLMEHQNSKINVEPELMEHQNSKINVEPELMEQEESYPIPQEPPFHIKEEPRQEESSNVEEPTRKQPVPKLRHRSFVWNYFIVKPDDKLKSICQICNKVVARGRLGKTLTTSNMRYHLSACHRICEQGKLCPPVDTKKNNEEKLFKFCSTYFTENPNNELKVICKICDAKISRGIDKNHPKSIHMKSHLLYNHGISHPGSQSLTATNQHYSSVWEYCHVDPSNKLRAICGLCNVSLPRGTNTNRLNTTCLINHLSRKHDITENFESDSQQWSIDEPCTSSTSIQDHCDETHKLRNTDLEIDNRCESENNTQANHELELGWYNQSMAETPQIVATYNQSEDYGKIQQRGSYASSNPHYQNTPISESFAWKYFHTSSENHDLMCNVCDFIIFPTSQEENEIIAAMMEHLSQAHDVGKESRSVAVLPKMPKRTSVVWDHFHVDEKDMFKGVCNICNASIARGRNPLKLNTSNMKFHLLSVHGIGNSKKTKDEIIKQ